MARRNVRPIPADHHPDTMGKVLARLAEVTAAVQASGVRFSTETFEVDPQIAVDRAAVVWLRPGTYGIAVTVYRDTYVDDVYLRVVDSDDEDVTDRNEAMDAEGCVAQAMRLTQAAA